MTLEILNKKYLLQNELYLKDIHDEDILEYMVAMYNELYRDREAIIKERDSLKCDEDVHLDHIRKLENTVCMMGDKFIDISRCLDKVRDHFINNPIVRENSNVVTLCNKRKS